MKPNFISHKEYQDSIISQLNKFYSGGLLTLVNSDWAIIYKLWITDLSGVHDLLIDTYSTKHPIGYNPTDMLRSFLLFLFINPSIGLTK